METDPSLTPSGEITPALAEITPKVEEAAPSLPEGEVKAAEALPEPIKPPKKDHGFQRRIDKLVSEREYYRGLAEGRQPGAKPEVEVIPGLALPPEPKENDFDDYGQYLKAMAQHGVQVELIKERATREYAAQQQSQQKLAESYSQWVDAGEEKFEGFEGIAEHVGGKITPHMGDAIRDSEYSHELVQYFYEHPKEMIRVSQMSPTAAVREIIKLEGRVSQPPQITDTKAPKTTAPVGGKETPGGKIEDMSYEDYKITRERQLGWRK